MADKYQIWDKVTDVYTPSGDVYTPEQWVTRWPIARRPGVKLVISTGDYNGGFCMPFNDMKAHYKRMGVVITDDMTDDEVLTAIEEFEANPPGSGEPSVEERTAAALEYLAMNSLPDETA